MRNKVNQSNESKKEYIKKNSAFIGFMSETRTIDEIMNYLNMGNRATRNRLSELAHYFPLISTSDEKGYKIATINEIENAQHELNELKCRRAVLNKRMKPLVALIKVSEKGVNL